MGECSAGSLQSSARSVQIRTWVSKLFATLTLGTAALEVHRAARPPKRHASVRKDDPMPFMPQRPRYQRVLLGGGRGIVAIPLLADALARPAYLPLLRLLSRLPILQRLERWVAVQPRWLIPIVLAGTVLWRRTSQGRWPSLDQRRAVPTRCCAPRLCLWRELCPRRAHLSCRPGQASHL